MSLALRKGAKSAASEGDIVFQSEAAPQSNGHFTLISRGRHVQASEIIVLPMMTA
jgi:hypothetical protein